MTIYEKLLIQKSDTMNPPCYMLSFHPRFEAKGVSRLVDDIHEIKSGKGGLRLLNSCLLYLTLCKNFLKRPETMQYSTAYMTQLNLVVVECISSRVVDTTDDVSQ